MCDFFILSSETPGLYEPRACKVIRKLRVRSYWKHILVSVKPDIPKDAYGTEHDISKLILTSMDIFTSLLKIKRKQWPVNVNILTLQPDLILDNGYLDFEKTGNPDHGVLFKTENDAWEKFRKDLVAGEHAEALWEKWTLGE